MPAKYVATNATTPVQLFGEDISRVVFTVYVTDTEDEHIVYDGTGETAILILKPGELLVVSALEGHNPSKPWYIMSQNINSGVYVYEEFLAPAVKRKMEDLGVKGEAGGFNPWVLLLLLAGGAAS